MENRRTEPVVKRNAMAIGIGMRMGVGVGLDVGSVTEWAT